MDGRITYCRCYPTIGEKCWCRWRNCFFPAPSNKCTCKLNNSDLVLCFQDGLDFLQRNYSSGIRFLAAFSDGSAQVLYPLTDFCTNITQECLGILVQYMCILILIDMASVIPRVSWLLLSWSPKIMEGSASYTMTVTHPVDQFEPYSSLTIGRCVITAMEAYGNNVHQVHRIFLWDKFQRATYTTIIK